MRPPRSAGSRTCLPGAQGDRRGRERRAGALAGVAGVRPAARGGRHLPRAAARSGRAADRDLDDMRRAVRRRRRAHVDRLPAADAPAFADYLAAQRIAGRQPGAVRARRATPCRILTAHASARSRVDGRRGAGRAGRRVAGPAAARQPARRRAHGGPCRRHRRPGLRRCRGSRRCSPRSAGCSTGRGQPRAAQAAGERDPGRRRAAVPVPRRAGRRRPDATSHARCTGPAAA